MSIEGIVRAALAENAERLRSPEPPIDALVAGGERQRRRRVSVLLSAAAVTAALALAATRVDAFDRAVEPAAPSAEQVGTSGTLDCSDAVPATTSPGDPGSGVPATVAASSPGRSEGLSEDGSDEIHILWFGDTYTWENGVAVTIGAPVPCQPSETATRNEVRNSLHFSLVPVTITSGSGEPVDPMTLLRVEPVLNVSNGVRVFDDAKGIFESHSLAITPGDEVKFSILVGSHWPGEFYLQVAPAPSYENVRFTPVRG